MGFASKICDLFYLRTIISIFFYCLDVGSDGNLSVRYYADGDVWWSALTALFVGLHWIYWVVNQAGALFVLVLGNEKVDEEGKTYVALPRWPFSKMFKIYNFTKKDVSIGLPFSIFNLFPVYLLLDAMRERWNNETDKSEARKSWATRARLREVAFEALPASMLQLYIAGRKNRFDAHVLFAIFTSLASLIYGAFLGFLAMVENADKRGFYERQNRNLYYTKANRYSRVFRRKFISALFVLPWVLLTAISFLPPLSFLISLKNHANPGLAAILIYLPAHVLYCRRFAFLLNFRKIHIFWSISLQLIFTIVTIVVSTFWFVSLTPFVENNLISLSVGPFYAWVLNASDASVNASTYPWAFCNASSETILMMTLPHSNSSSTDTTMTDTISSLWKSTLSTLSQKYCLTNYAERLYVIFISTSCILFIHHCFAVALWSRIDDKFFSSRAMEKLATENLDELEEKVRKAKEKKEKWKNQVDVDIEKLTIKKREVEEKIEEWERTGRIRLTFKEIFSRDRDPLSRKSMKWLKNAKDEITEDVEKLEKQRNKRLGRMLESNEEEINEGTSMLGTGENEETGGENGENDDGREAANESLLEVRVVETPPMNSHLVSDVDEDSFSVRVDIERPPNTSRPVGTTDDDIVDTGFTNVASNTLHLDGRKRNKSLLPTITQRKGMLWSLLSQRPDDTTAATAPSVGATDDDSVTTGSTDISTHTSSPVDTASTESSTNFPRSFGTIDEGVQSASTNIPTNSNHPAGNTDNDGIDPASNSPHPVSTADNEGVNHPSNNIATNSSDHTSNTDNDGFDHASMNISSISPHSASITENEGVKRATTNISGNLPDRTTDNNEINPATTNISANSAHPDFNKEKDGLNSALTNIPINSVHPASSTEDDGINLASTNIPTNSTHPADSTEDDGFNPASTNISTNFTHPASRTEDDGINPASTNIPMNFTHSASSKEDDSINRAATITPTNFNYPSSNTDPINIDAPSTDTFSTYPDASSSRNKNKNHEVE